MTKFKKGVSGNPNGRPKGSVNKTTSDMKDILNHALFGDADSIIEDMAKLEPRDRLMMKAKFAPFILPTLKSVDNNITTGKDVSLGFSIEYKDEFKEDSEEE